MGNEHLPETRRLSSANPSGPLARLGDVMFRQRRRVVLAWTLGLVVDWLDPVLPRSEVEPARTRPAEGEA